MYQVCLYLLPSELGYTHVWLCFFLWALEGIWLSPYVFG